MRLKCKWFGLWSTTFNKKNEKEEEEEGETQRKNEILYDKWQVIISINICIVVYRDHSDRNKKKTWLAHCRCIYAVWLFDGDDFQFSLPWRYNRRKKTTYSFLKFTFDNIQRYCTPNTKHWTQTYYCYMLCMTMTREIRYFFTFFRLQVSENRFENYWNCLNSCILLLSNGRSFYFQFFLCFSLSLNFHTATNKLVNEAWRLKPEVFVSTLSILFYIELNDQQREKKMLIEFMFYQIVTYHFYMECEQHW